MASIRQTNFSAGEVSPLLWGRSDLGVYGKGLRRCKDFFIAKTGAAVSRPGTTFVAESRNPVVEEFGQDISLFRLVPFVFSDDEAYVCEFGIGYILIRLRGVVVGEVNGTAIEAADLPKLKWAQTGDLLTVCIPSSTFTAPMELRRLSQTSWHWAATSLRPPDPEMPDVGASQMANPFNPGSSPTGISTTPFMLLASSLVAPDVDHPELEWIYAFTAIMQRVSDGLTVESIAQVVKFSTDGVEHLNVDSDPIVQDLLEDHLVVVYPDKPVKLVRLGEGVTTDDEWRTLSFRIYRGRGDLLGWIGDTRSREFIDIGDTPDYAVQPPLGSNPFRVIKGTGPHPSSSLTVPLAVGFFQERRCFGGTTGDSNTPPRAGTLFTSATGDYYNFDERLAIHVAGEALVFDLASRRWEEIRHLVSLDRLLALTSSSAWSVAGTQGSPLDFDSIDARVVDEVGSTHVPPVVVDQSALFVRAKGTGARALVPSQREGGYEGADISEVSAHLFIGPSRAIIDWAYAEDPWGVVWAVRADGALLSLTYTRQGWGWARHETHGLVESICTVPEGDEDAVYLVVKRVIDGVDKRYIERMTSRHSRAPEIGEGAAVLSDDGAMVTTPPDFICVDSAIQYLGAPTSSFTGLGGLEGEEVWVLAQGHAPLGPYVVEGGTIDVVEELATNVTCLAGSYLLTYIGMSYTPELETLDANPNDRLKTKVVERVGFEVDQSIGLEAGQDFDHLDDWAVRSVEDGYNALSAATALIDIAVEGTNDQSARAVLRQALPLPVTVVGLTRELA